LLAGLCRPSSASVLAAGVSVTYLTNS